MLLLFVCCHVVIDGLCFFLKVSLVGLQCVIVVFPDHTHLPFNAIISCDLEYKLLIDYRSNPKQLHIQCSRFGCKIIIRHGGSGLRLNDGPDENVQYWVGV